MNFKLATKNASSSGYILSMFAIEFGERPRRRRYTLPGIEGQPAPAERS